MDHRHIVMIIFAAFALVEVGLGRFAHREATTRKDVVIEIGAAIFLAAVVVPATLWVTELGMSWAWPHSRDACAGWPVWALAATLLVVDDLSQYAWHRLSHAVPALYRLHRAHHSAEYMSVRVVYRNSLIYYALMPGLWLAGVLLHLGFAPVYYVYFVAKMAVIIGAHSSVPWDEPLWRVRWLRPVMWLVTRVISTPRTHAAHHGKHLDDGVTHYKGNYGNFLFIWDVIFGTAKIADRRPDEYGLENVAPATWQEELLVLWPSRARPDRVPAASVPEASPPLLRSSPCPPATRT